MPTRPTLLPVLLSPEAASTGAQGGPSATVDPPDPAGPSTAVRGDNQSGTRVQG
jgi:hypothetical protein